MTQDIKITPMMAQWHACKEKAGQHLLLFRMGDFYEAFYEDAEILSRIADLTLTQRQSIPMAGIPFHAAENYIDKLIAAGISVAIAEQIEDSKAAKGLVKREIVRTITPGTIFCSSLLADHKNNFFASITQIGSIFGLSFLDISTGTFNAIESDDLEKIKNELEALKPSEILVSKKFHARHANLFSDLQTSFHILISVQDNWIFDYELSYTTLTNQFAIHNLDGFGLKGQNSAINAAGALLAYIKDHLYLPLKHIKAISTYQIGSFLTLDRMTLKNLELLEPIQGSSKQKTLLSVLNHTVTPMGKRLLRQWIVQPLQNIETIHKRQDAIEELQSQFNNLFDRLQHIKDLERLITRVETRLANPRDLLALKASLEALPALKELLKTFKSPLLAEKIFDIKDLSSLTHTLKEALHPEAPVKINDGCVFNTGYNKELDHLRELSLNSKTWLNLYQTRLREETQIKTLKVGFTSAFGYYIEVSKGQTSKIPISFQRRQTLVNAERFITEELKEYEEKVLKAEELRQQLENRLFSELLEYTSQFTEVIFLAAKSIAVIDCLTSLAYAAKYLSYVRPIVDNSKHLHILGGRHPVIEASLIQETFTPNDTLLDDLDNRLMLITGPNMAGKSTYIRQVALITLMAHIGSFVPAKFAHIGLVDKIFTRIGASDDLARGQSTFMVEMSETANILNNATNRSLIILDEIGRGTSTYDGISIAWSTAEFLLLEKQPKTLFATHYFELTTLEEEIKGVKNYNVSVLEDREGITFLHKIMPGCAAKSYGIHVAKLAGMPPSVVERAKAILNDLEVSYGKDKKLLLPSKKTRQKRLDDQLMLFDHV